MKNDTAEITIADLMALLLKAFKPILCATLVFALIGGFFGFFRAMNDRKHISALEEDVKAAEESFLSSQEKLAEAEDDLTTRKEIEFSQAEDLINNSEELVFNRKKYLEESLYCAIDPFHCGVSRMTVQIHSENDAPEETTSVLTALLSNLFSDNSEFPLSIQKIIKSDAEYAYIRELISISYLSDNLAEITVFHSDPQIAEEAAEAICLELSHYLNQNGNYSFEVIDRFNGIEVNWEMYERQLSAKRELVSAEQTLMDAREKLQRIKSEVPDLEKAVEDAEKTLEKELNALQKTQKKYNTIASNSNTVKSSIRYLISMLFVGLFLSCFFVIAINLLSGRLLNRRMALSSFDYPLLGILPTDKPCLFEKTIRKLEDENNADYQSSSNAVAQTLVSLASNHSVCFVSSLGKDAAKNLVSLTDGHISICGDIVNDPDAIKTLSSFDSIILVEKKNVSLLSMINHEIQRANALGKDILGIVLI